MSATIASPPPTQMRPPGRTWRRAASVLIAVLVAVSSLVFGALPAHAGSHGVGYDEGLGFLGAYSTDVDGRQAYCIDLGANSPFGPTSGPQTVTSLDSLSRQELAELNYVLDRWGQSGDPNSPPRSRCSCGRWPIRASTTATACRETTTTWAAPPPTRAARSSATSR